jgi:hypothetical protein
LGVGVIHLIERTVSGEIERTVSGEIERTVSGETSVTICIAVGRAEIVGKMIQEQREREYENDRGMTKQLTRDCDM